MNSWIYTTNHKRIAVNYFNFVLVAGTAGMSLATIIRLEFAYPGVGILAGDSIQYLSIATSHGVIMVFFMIMPAVFGAFGNFLLPTQLGVHDVAFPRLNSAAFWFLPGGLIMLCQLVCVDRRYQRMNCFNIRELQGILKRKFFTDLVNTNDHRELFDKSIIGLRFKSNNHLSINHDMALMYNFGTTNTPKSKYTLFDNNYLNTLSNDTYYSLKDTLLLVSANLVNYINSHFALDLARTPYSKPHMTNLSIFPIELINEFIFLIKNILCLSKTYSIQTLLSSINIPFIAPKYLLNDFMSMNLAVNMFSITSPISDLHVNKVFESTNIVFSSENVLFNNLKVDMSSSMSEISSSLRFTRFNNPLISYDYKCGNYLGI